MRILIGSALNYVDKDRRQMRKRRTTLLILTGAVVLLMLALLPSAKPAARITRAPDPPTATVAAPTAAPSPRPTDLPATALPTSTPAPFTFPPRSQVASVDIGGLTVEMAKQHVAAAIDAHKRTIALHAGDYATTLQTDKYLKLPSAGQLVDRARTNVRGQAPVRLPLQVSVDHPALTAFVDQLAPRLAQPAATSVISDAKALTETFTFAMSPGRKLDVPRSVNQIAREIIRPNGAQQVELVFEPAAIRRPPMAELERVLRQHATFWNGVAGFYVHDLLTGETISYNADTVFSGASIMKVPIMIFAYSRLGELDDEQHDWMQKMIIESQNLEANSLLAAAVSGSGTEAALQGVNEMTAMLKSLGLEHTYQLIPYESGDWLIQQSRLPGGGPAQEGQPPFTAPDPYIRTSPREMGELFTMLDQCSRGTGPLLAKVGGRLSPQICKEMIGWLQQPHDQERMVAGLPPGTTVAHKGGWIDDMQSDVGIVDSPGGRYVAAIYIWREGYVTDENASPSPYLGDFSHTIYTFFNPKPLDSAQIPRIAGG